MTKRSAVVSCALAVGFLIAAVAEDAAPPHPPLARTPHHTPRRARPMADALQPFIIMIFYFTFFTFEREPTLISGGPFYHGDA